MQQATANVIGTPGGSVSRMSGAYEGRAAIGKAGEQRTARALAGLCQGSGPTVLHDLRLPMGKVSANIDHIVVAGQQVTILDSKAWRPGHIWTFRGQTRRGLHRFSAGDRRTLELAQVAIAALLNRSGIECQIAKPIMVVWPSNDSKPLRLWRFRPAGAQAVSGRRFARRTKQLVGSAPADRRIVSALFPLVIGSGAQEPDEDPFA